MGQGIYSVEQDGPGGILVRRLGEEDAWLRDGNALQIALTFQNLQQQDQRRADDFMSGVMLGIAYIALTTGRMPVAEAEK